MKVNNQFKTYEHKHCNQKRILRGALKMKRLWIISGAITLTLTIAVSQFETKAPEGWGFGHCTSTNKNCGRLE